MYGAVKVLVFFYHNVVLQCQMLISKQPQFICISNALAFVTRRLIG